jgi:hypothetical protein
MTVQETAAAIPGRKPRHAGAGHLFVESEE